MIKENILSKEICKGRHGKRTSTSIKILVILLFVFISCGCSKSGLSPTEFTRKMEEEKYAVTDLSNKQNKAILAVGDHYQVYYYQYDSDDLAKKSLETEIILLKEGNNKVEENVTDKREKYEVENDKIYIVYSRINNTYVYIGAPKKYKNEVTKLLKYIGY